MSLNQKLSKLRADGYITDDEYKILKQEPCEDAISRQAVKAYKYHRTVYPNFEDYVDMLPPVKPQEPKTEHWKRISADKYSEHAMYWYRCDKCGKDNLGDTAYCPNCGCRMIESQETETWNGIHGQITAPKGTFERIFNDADDDNDI